MVDYRSYPSHQIPYQGWSSTSSYLACPQITTEFRGNAWNCLHRAVLNLWPSSKDWIMLHAPADMDANGSSREGNIEVSDYAAILDPYNSQKHSTLERVGFSMSDEAFRTACALIQELAARGHDFQGLLDYDVNPFFIIYAFADCNLPLPDGFSRKLFWKHLDGIVRAQCWSGLDFTHGQAGTSTGSQGRAVAVRLQFSWQDDPEAIVHKLVFLRNTARPPEPTNLFPHELRLVISGCRWVASSYVGSFWYEASDLEPKDVASFALLDTFTRWLPRWRGGILQVHTNDVCVMWGVRGTYSGLWHEVRALCAQYDVQLQARLGEQPSFNSRRRDDYAGESPNRALRDPEVVNAAVNWLMSHGKQGSAAYSKMLDHLRT